MITIITGTPGAGKTLYTVQHYLQHLVGSTVTKTHDDGSTEQVPRTIYTNINGLLLDHELIDGSDTGGLNNWHEWAKPGSVIVFDEVQKSWPPRPNGAKVPDYIQALETHRHMGVDFILITQGIMLIDRNLIALAGQHLHIRRLGNSRTCIVYEWDHVSRSLMYAKSISKKLWRYDPKIFKLYKSAELHTKQKRKLPGLIWFVLIALAVLIWQIPQVSSIFNPTPAPTATPQNAQKPATALPSFQSPPTHHDTPKNATTPLEQQPQPITAEQLAQSFEPRIDGLPHTAPRYDHLTQPVIAPRPAMCMSMGTRCNCYTQQATRITTITDATCRDLVKGGYFHDWQPDPTSSSTTAAIAAPLPD